MAMLGWNQQHCNYLGSDIAIAFAFFMHTYNIEITLCLRIIYLFFECVATPQPSCYGTKLECMKRTKTTLTYLTFGILKRQCHVHCHHLNAAGFKVFTCVCYAFNVD